MLYSLMYDLLSDKYTTSQYSEVWALTNSMGVFFQFLLRTVYIAE